MNREYVKCLKEYNSMGGEEAFDKGRKDEQFIELRNRIKQLEITLPSQVIINSIKSMFKVK